MTEIAKVATHVADYLAPFLALFALLAAIIEAMSKTLKPISGITKWLRRRFGSGVEEKIDRLSNCIGEVKGLVTELTNENERQNAKLDTLQSQVTENEKNRLSDNIFKMGFYARQGQPITDREFLQLQENFTKYHDRLHGNGRAAEEYEFVLDYYNRKGWLTMKPTAPTRRKEKPV